VWLWRADGDGDDDDNHVPLSHPHMVVPRPARQLGEYPHIGLLDPRTGQLLRSWGGFVAAATLLDELRSFVASHSLDDLSAAPLPPQQSRPQSDRTTKQARTLHSTPLRRSCCRHSRAQNTHQLHSLLQKAKVDLTEEEMLAEAIAASLRESHPQATGAPPLSSVCHVQAG
jgi:hypothetical protein